MSEAPPRKAVDMVAAILRDLAGQLRVNPQEHTHHGVLAAVSAVDRTSDAVHISAHAWERLRDHGNLKRAADELDRIAHETGATLPHFHADVSQKVITVAVDELLREGGIDHDVPPGGMSKSQLRKLFVRPPTRAHELLASIRRAIDDGDMVTAESKCLTLKLLLHDMHVAQGES